MKRFLSLIAIGFLISCGDNRPNETPGRGPGNMPVLDTAALRVNQGGFSTDIGGDTNRGMRRDTMRVDTMR